MFSADDLTVPVQPVPPFLQKHIVVKICPQYLQPDPFRKARVPDPQYFAPVSERDFRRRARAIRHHAARRRHERFFPFAAVYRSDFQKVAFHLSVGRDQSVYTEVAVMLRLSEISAVQESFFCSDGMIAPLPHKTAHKAVASVYFAPIVVHVAVAVPHCMRILAQHIRTRFTPIRKIFSKALNRRIHTADNIQTIGIIFRSVRLKNAFVMNRTAIPVPNIVCPCIKHRAIT